MFKNLEDNKLIRVSSHHVALTRRGMSPYNYVISRIIYGINKETTMN